MGGGSQGENKSKSDETQNGLNWHRNRISSILRKLRVFEKQIKKKIKNNLILSHITGYEVLGRLAEQEG